APPVSSPLSLHDALPIWRRRRVDDQPFRQVGIDVAYAAVGAGNDSTASERGEVEVDREDVRVTAGQRFGRAVLGIGGQAKARDRSEEHTSELQSLTNIVC